MEDLKDKLDSLNPFKKIAQLQARRAEEKRQQSVAAQIASQRRREASSSAGQTSFRRLDTGVRKQLSTEECLKAVSNLLDQLRTMNPNDVHAFPLLNESQRLVQQLRETPGVQQGPDKDAWLL